MAWQENFTIYEKVNPNFYPEPIIVDTSVTPHNLIRKSNGFLTKNDFEKIYDKCGKLLHSESPFQTENDIAEMYNFYERNIHDWCVKIMGLLEAHKIALADGDTMLFVVLRTKDADAPSGNVFEKIQE